MAVPLLLNQIWIGSELPARAENLVARWTQFNPAMTTRLLDEDACRDAVKDVCAQYLPTYEALPFVVMKADIARLAVLYRDGGLYADVDMYVHKSLPSDLFDRPMSVSVETRLTTARQRELGFKHPLQIANCFFAAERGHLFIRKLLETSLQACQSKNAILLDEVEELTGPRFLTRAIQQARPADVWVGPQIQYMAPMDYPDVWPINRHFVTRHETHGSWKQERVLQYWPQRLKRKWVERNKLINPLRLEKWRPASEIFGAP